MEQVRSPLQGSWNIIRFNWHLYVFSLGLFLHLFLLSLFASQAIGWYLNILCWLIFLSTATSLLVSFYVYDCSNLYKFEWLKEIEINGSKQLINVHAGFDETSQLLEERFKGAGLRVLDFYDAALHTEVSVKRARRAYPSFPGTERVRTSSLPLANNAADVIFVFFSAHEIRDEAERIIFFKELNRIIKPGGKIVVTEHLRDMPNFLAYNVGFFHFYSRLAWGKTFKAAKLDIEKEFKITPFVSTFILLKNEISS